jgi:general secretion pathway protein G
MGEAGAPMMSRAGCDRRGRRSQGFTLIELLIVVAIIGIIAAVAIPNLMNALDKGKQKRTMSDMRAIATAVESYGVDHSKYPMSIASWTTLKPLLNPFFIKDPPDLDGWSTVWDTTTDATGGSYTVSSLGKYGIADSRPGGTTNDFACDIVFVVGQFFQWPQGTQE